MSPRRTNAGKVALYQEAGTVLRENRRELLQVWGVVLAVVVFVNLLPGIPEYLRGLGTGTLLTFSAAVTLWFVWYGNGLGHRLEGTWAEEWTGEQLRAAASVFEVVPGLRFDRFDIDHIAIARHGVYLIETKRHRMLYPGTIERDVVRAAAASRTASNFLQRGIDSSPPATMISALLVYWGKAGRELDAREFETSTGTVTLVGGAKLRTWLDERGNGYIGPDYAQSLAQELTSIADAREQLLAPKSRLIRWFARTG